MNNKEQKPALVSWFLFWKFSEFIYSMQKSDHNIVDWW